MSESPRRVLLVDDEPRNLRLLDGILAPLDYELRQAPSGLEALKSVETDPPDIVLLDLMMPGLAGLDVCRLLKANASTRFIPVVLITSLADRDSKLAGLEAGADDFVNRPVEPTELRARVKSLLHGKALHDELQARYEDLRRLERLREGLSQMLVHDLRNPLTAIVGYLELVESGHVTGPAATDCVATARRSAVRLVDMVSCLLDLAKSESGEMRFQYSAVDVGRLVEEVREELRSLLERRQLVLELDAEPTLPRLWADREGLRRVILNLVANAISFSPSGGRIRVSGFPAAEALRVEVEDEGPGIPAEDQARIFTKFGQVEGRRSGRKYSTGLGLAFCKMAIEAQGGAIGVESAPGKGTTFWFTLPVAASVADQEQVAV